MAAKRSLSSPPPAQSSTSDGEASSSDEEQEVAKVAPSQTKNPKRTERDDDESDSDSGSDSEPEPPAVAKNTAQKPSQPDGSSDEEEDEEEEEEKEEEKPKPLAKKPESEPDKKKLKPSDPDQSPSKKSQSGIINRIWAPEDEMALLRALSEYQDKHRKLPPQKDYDSFLSGISGLIRFPVTEKQLFNKVRHLRHVHGNLKKKSVVKFSDPHKKAVFDLCEKVFEVNSKVPKKEVAEESDDDVGMKNRGAANAGAANGGATSGGVKVGSELSYPYLRGMIEELVSRQQSLSVLGKIGDVVGLFGESKAQYFEEKIKELKIDAMKLGVKELKLTTKLVDFLTDELAKAGD